VCQGTICQQIWRLTTANAEYALANYGYIWTRGKFVQMLHHHWFESGVKGIFKAIRADHSGPRTVIMPSIALTSGEQIAGTLCMWLQWFCQQFLIGKHYQIPFVSKQHILSNDNCSAVQMEHGPQMRFLLPLAGRYRSEMVGFWDIALQNRRGVGHRIFAVFSNVSKQKSLV